MTIVTWLQTDTRSTSSKKTTAERNIRSAFDPPQPRLRGGAFVSWPGVKEDQTARASEAACPAPRFAALAPFADRLAHGPKTSCGFRNDHASIASVKAFSAHPAGHTALQLDLVYFLAGAFAFAGAALALGAAAFFTAGFVAAAAAFLAGAALAAGLAAAFAGAAFLAAGFAAGLAAGFLAGAALAAGFAAAFAGAAFFTAGLATALAAAGFLAGAAFAFAGAAFGLAAGAAFFTAAATFAVAAFTGAFFAGVLDAGALDDCFAMSCPLRYADGRE
ncbi:hypothetical protein [Mesorhizobium sp. P5_C1]